MFLAGGMVLFWDALILTDGLQTTTRLVLGNGCRVQVRAKGGQGIEAEFSNMHKLPLL
jgi:hypothetical protein